VLGTGTDARSSGFDRGADRRRGLCATALAASGDLNPDGCMTTRWSAATPACRPRTGSTARNRSPSAPTGDRSMSPRTRTTLRHLHPGRRDRPLQTPKRSYVAALPSPIHCGFVPRPAPGPFDRGAGRARGPL